MRKTLLTGTSRNAKLAVMKLDQYLQQQGRGAELAKSLGVPAVLISQWKTGSRQVPAERCPAIEKATDGLVRCEDLRSDIDWAYLRTSQQTTDQK